MFPRARTPEGEIAGAGGAYVRRPFQFGERKVVNGDTLTAEEVASIPDANLRSLINLNHIELYPAVPPSADEAELRSVIAEKNAEIKELRERLAQAPAATPSVGGGDCFMMAADAEGKKFHIIQGRQVTDEPLTRAKAQAKMKELTS